MIVQFKNPNHQWLAVTNKTAVEIAVAMEHGEKIIKITDDKGLKLLISLDEILFIAEPDMRNPTRYPIEII
jgi:hypothetical protein